VDESKSPIELLHSETVEDALQLLAIGGLAEAQLFVRPARTLSAGQRYRLGIALALASRPAVMFVDEFCEPLDRFTALAVSKQLRAASIRLGVAMVVATADATRIITTLQPDKVIRLSWGGDVAVIDNWKHATT
jgi:ABC-type ATPase with predicted acetyltransferase domain